MRTRVHSSRKTPIASRAWAVALSVALVLGGLPAYPALGDEATDEALGAQTVEASQPNPEPLGDDGAQTAAENEASSDDATAEPAAQTGEGANAQPAAEVQNPYTIEATFDGNVLAEGADANNLTDVWKTGAKSLTVKLTKSADAQIDPSKQYVLCLSVPDTLYFSGVPDPAKINGLEDTAMIQNAAPTFNVTLKKTQTYALSKYSGQMRLRLNTAVDKITIADLGVSFDPQLLGYSATENTALKDALSIRVVAVDASAQLDTFSDSAATELLSRTVSSMQINNGESFATDKVLRMRLSTDGFVNETSTGGSLNIGRSGNIAYVLESGQKSSQAYGKLTVVFGCPYIMVDADGDGTKEPHYLSFDEDSAVLKKDGNEMGPGSLAKGLNMAADAVYDAAAHTITYTFENAYLAAWQMIAVTPQFSWPSDLGESVAIPSEGILVQRDNWKLTTETTYCGTDTTLLPRDTEAGGGKGTFIPDGVNMTLQSSNENVLENRSARASLFGQRVIYEGVNRESGLPGGLGFFDFHNTGVSAGPTSKVTFAFNTEEGADSGNFATYYVTSVNIPLDGNTGGTDVDYTLVDGSGQTISGTKHYPSSSSFTVKASDLVKGAGTGTGYYIKQISYTTTTFRPNATYHTEVTHGRRNFVIDSGLFFGYIEGASEGMNASATMTVESLNGEPLNAAGDTKLESTETSWIGNDDSVYPSISTGARLDGSTSQSITAGGTTTLSFSPIISNAEDQSYEFHGTSQQPTGILNGYHVVRNPIMYVCLPKGVSIAGPEQATINVGGGAKTTQATSVSQLENSECTFNGTDAVWWEVRFDGANVKTSAALMKLKLSSSLFMQNVNWNFEKAIAFRANGQAFKGTGTAVGFSPAVNTTARLSQLANGNTMLTALASALKDDPYDDKGYGEGGKLGLAFYTYSVATTLNITRAEAKLDVDTELSTGSTTSASLKVTNANAQVNYSVGVSSDDGGTANDFQYYIPIPKTTSAHDADSFVSRNDYNLKLTGEVQVTDRTANSNSAQSTFQVCYTTVEGLDSTSVRALPASDWKSADEMGGDFSAVTAVMVSTAPKAQVAAGSSYMFTLPLSYDNAKGDFNSQAGRVVQWRSFGHYTYTRNGSTEENSYPSNDSSVKLGYRANLTGTPINVPISTGAASSTASVTSSLGQTFVNSQALVVKSVSVAGGTTLTQSDPTSLTGSEANSTFKLDFGPDAGSLDTMTSKTKASAFSTVAAGSDVGLYAQVSFSRALTDSTTARYVDIVLGNDDIDVTVRVNFARTVVPVSVTGSGTAAGEIFQAASVSDQTTAVASNAAFTALFDVADFVPGNFSAQTLTWKKDGAEATLPAGTTVTMLVLNGSDAVESWWLHKANGIESAIDLTAFTRMCGSDGFSYDTESVETCELKYQFVVSLPEDCDDTGDYTIGFKATPVEGATSVVSELPVRLASPASFNLSANGATASWGYTPSAGGDSRTAGKQLALVMTPRSPATLPADAKIVASDAGVAVTSDEPGTTYERTAQGNYLVRLGTVGSGSIDLSLASDMMPASGGSFDFEARLVLYAGDVEAPMAGTEVDDATATLDVAAKPTPSIKVTGTRVAHKAEWASGAAFDFKVEGVPNGATVTVTAYNGLAYSSPATTLMSSIGGVFEVNGNTGTYQGGTQTGKLVLNSAAEAGTYRLVFEVKQDGATIASAPYYLIVRE